MVFSDFSRVEPAFIQSYAIFFCLISDIFREIRCNKSRRCFPAPSAFYLIVLFFPHEKDRHPAAHRRRNTRYPVPPPMKLCLLFRAVCITFSPVSAVIRSFCREPAGIPLAPSAQVCVRTVARLLPAVIPSIVLRDKRAAHNSFPHRSSMDAPICLASSSSSG